MDVVRSIETLALVAGHLALDFANTVNSRVATLHDYLGSYENLVAWAGRTGALDDATLAAVRQAARRHPDGAAAGLRTAHRRREQIVAVFSALAAGDQPPRREFRAVLAAYGDAIARSEPALGPDGVRLTWPSDNVLRPLWPIAYDAGRLLLSADVEIVKECPGCGWLFLDRSRNRNRRWCDMQVCGSRAKMRRYRRAVDSDRTARSSAQS